MEDFFSYVQHLTAWTAVNLVVPYLFPLAVVRFVQRWQLALSLEQMQRLRLTYLLKEAQLSLVNVAVAAIGVYELLPVPPSAALPSLRYFLFALLVMLIALNTLLFVFGTVIGNPPVEQSVGAGISWDEWQKLYPMGAWSIRLGVVCAIVAFGSHFVVFSDEQGHKKGAQIRHSQFVEPAASVGSH